MDYEQFLKQVAEDLKYSIPNATIEISDVVKVQGEFYRGISVPGNRSLLFGVGNWAQFKV